MQMGLKKNVKTLTKTMVKALIEKFEKLSVKFDRVSYRKSYDHIYFKVMSVCPVCGRRVTRHQMKRHNKTKRCLASR